MLACGIRICQALVLQTVFSPDEFWQSLEVAHRITFGFGHLTWEWGAGVRSYLHPLLFVGPLKVLQLAGWDSSRAVLLTPKVQQAFFAAVTDLYVFHLAQQQFGNTAARWTSLCQLASWFNAYCLVRTYAGCLEALAAVAGVYHLTAWHCSIANEGRSQRSGGRGSERIDNCGAAAVGHLRIALIAAGLGIALRPPSLLLWLPIAAVSAGAVGKGLRLRAAVETAAVASVIVTASCAIDRAFYGRWLFVPWEFAKFNLFQGGSSLYGSHPWHWNFSQGIPTVAGTLLPLILLGVVVAKRRWLAALAAWSAVTYSLQSHKEFRFLLPALQLAMPFAGVALEYLRRETASYTAPLVHCMPDGRASAAAPAEAKSSYAASEDDQAVGASVEDATESKVALYTSNDPLLVARHQQQVLRYRQQTPATSSQQGCLRLDAESIKSRGIDAASKRPQLRSVMYRAGIAAVALQIPAALYFGMRHQRGTIAVMQHLTATLEQGDYVLFLTPCHAGPWQSHLHRLLPTMRFLDCSPPGWAPVVYCLNAKTSPISRNGVENATPALRQDWPAHLSYCHRLFNGSAMADSSHRSSWQRFESQPLRVLEETESQDHNVASSRQLDSSKADCIRSSPATSSSSTGKSVPSRLTADRRPTHVILYNHMLPKIVQWLLQGGYNQTNSFAHADFAVDREHEAAVLVYTRAVPGT